MKKLLSFLFCIFLMVSCQSQIDLEGLTPGEDISTLAKNLKETREDREPNYGLLGYRTENLDQYKFGEVSFSKYELPEGHLLDYSRSYLFVDNFKKNRYLGFRLTLVNEKEGNQLLDYLRKQYGEPEVHEASNNGQAYVWYVKDQWILFSQDHISIDKKGNPFLTTNLIVVKQGTRVVNSTDPKVFTILESFNMAYPKKEKE
ncbi:hypothetical protein ETU08_03290 [Apibacter muscae]|uniref:hypothetical protein n=1 Tax=Apibacter muscae TaxID=2509004 RepID=UPI0011AC8459|nr:hypothetical protein [Apibacter muscae]TWP31045.1 hypothetical protein ETU08_03290 [Apibacter muscae]